MRGKFLKRPVRLGRAGVVSWLLSAALLFAFTPTISLAADQPEAGVNVPGQLIVRFLPDLNLQGMTGPGDAPPEVQAFFGRLGVSSLKPMGGKSNVYLLKITRPISEALALAQAERLVKQAEPNQVMKLEQTGGPSPEANELYASGKQWWLTKIEAPKAWTITTGSPDIRVGVVDSGIDGNHPDLKGHVAVEYDFLHEQPNVMDEAGHGTAVAACIGADTADNKGMAGINWNVRFINMKAGNEGLYVFDVSRGIIAAVDNGARIINGSFGSAGGSIAEAVAIEYAQSRGVVLVFSAGNSGSSRPQYPSGYPGVISVGATDYSDRVVDFSSFGPNTSLVAPGSGIWTAKPGGGYTSINGTSFSAPIVSGVASLILSVNPKLTPADVKNILEGTSDDISGQGFTVKTGWGRVNAYKAVLAAKNGDLLPNKRSSLTGKVSGVDPTKVRLSLDPLGLTFRPDKDGNFQIPNLGKATYRLRAAVTGAGTGQGVKEVRLTGQAGDNQTVNFAFQNQNIAPALEANYVDLARNFDALPSTARPVSQLWFAETGHTLSGTFRRYWEERGGLPVFGFPLSEPFQEFSSSDGKPYLVQYFERNRLELHPENAGTNYEVLLGLLGSEQTAGRNFPRGAPPNNGPIFAETGYTLDNRFLNYWQSRGGLTLFGLPISEAFIENGLLVQYFERNRFELHAENTADSVLLGLLGRDLALQRNYL